MRKNLEEKKVQTLTKKNCQSGLRAKENSMGEEKKIVTCRCCKKPAVDRNGKPKKAPICWDCICNAGSVERKCSEHGGFQE